MDRINYVVYITLLQCFSNVFARGPLLISKITTYFSILAHVKIECPDYRYPKLNIFMSELIVVSGKYIPVANVTMQCMT